MKPKPIKPVANSRVKAGSGTVALDEKFKAVPAELAVNTQVPSLVSRPASVLETVPAPFRVMLVALCENIYILVKSNVKLPTVQRPSMGVVIGSYIILEYDTGSNCARLSVALPKSPSGVPTIQASVTVISFDVRKSVLSRV